MDYQERETIIIGLVESALSRAIEERKAFLDTVLTTYPELVDEVKTRVDGATPRRQPAIVVNRDVPDRPFAAGELVAGRFLIVRELGRGGMGIVYEASDQKLHRTIAIKCARREFQSRLTPEARAALEVSHQNVCKLHELHTAQTPEGPVDFLTMEFIDGETLSDRISRDGRLSSEDARDLALQICAGLAQAHRQRVIHGDIKAGNVLVTRTPENAGRAVLTDFGLAKPMLGTLPSSASPASGSPHSIHSAQGGTLAYMAPELLTGARASVASDIYALGVLFHVMLTGSLVKRNPQQVPETLRTPAPWNRIVARCLQARPEDRFSSVEEILSALTVRRRPIRWLLASAAALVAILAALLWNFRQDSGPPVRLVIFPFEVEGAAIPAADGLAADVADRLSGARRNFTVIGPPEAVRDHVDTVEKARSTFGATHVLRTSLRHQAEQIVSHAVIADAASGQPLKELRGSYPASDPALITKALVGTVTGALGLRSRAPRESTASPAYPDYIQGVALMRRDGQSADQALPHFARAAQLDPRSALPYAGLAWALIQKFQRGEGRRVLDEAGENVAKAKSLNPDSVPVLLVSGLFQQVHGRYEQAIAEYIRATQLEPRNADAWRRLAIAYEKSDRSAEAIATYQKAIQAQPDYYGHYNAFGSFYLRRSDFRQSEELYRRSSSMAPGVADGHMGLGLALMQQGRFPEAEKALLESLRLDRTPQILMNLGALYYEEQRYPEALHYFEEAMALGPPSLIRYRDLGDGYRQVGRLKEAAEAYRAGARLAQADIARNPRDGQARANLALLAALLQDPRQAEFEIAQALAIEPENTLVLRNAAITYEVLGERDKALTALQTAPASLLEELNRQPDVKNLARDPRFQAMISKITGRK